MTTEKNPKRNREREKKKSETEQNDQQQTAAARKKRVRPVLCDTMLIIAILLKLLRNFNKRIFNFDCERKRNRNKIEKATKHQRRMWTQHENTQPLVSIGVVAVVAFFSCLLFLIINLLKDIALWLKMANISIHKFIRH